MDRRQFTSADLSQGNWGGIMNKGLTLVEILIIVVSLGILALSVVPRFAGASTEAKINTLASCLRMVRSQLELYRLEHSGYPSEGESASWIAQLTNTTDAAGDTAGSDLGPYIERFPENPFNNSGTVLIDADGSSAPGQAGCDVHGWYFNAVTGRFSPNTAEHSDW